MGGPTGTAVTETIAPAAASGPALALVDGRGEVVRLTENFRAGFAPEGSEQLIIWDFLADPDQRTQLGRVLEGRLLRAELALPSVAGSVAAEAEAVLDAAVTRHALLTVAPAATDPESSSGADLLLADPSLETSPAMVWIKDLSGCYLRVNRAYTTRLGVHAASIEGKTDADLPPAHVVAAPRVTGHRGDGPERVQLEYTAPPTAGRDALTVLRFPLHDRDGSVVAVCGVAATVAEAATARSEAERLLRIERWAGLSVAAIRAELIEEWQLAALAEPEEPTGPAPKLKPGRSSEPKSSAASAAELETLRRELAAAQAARTEIEGRLADEQVAKAALDARLLEEVARTAELRDAVAAATRSAEELGNTAATTARRQAAELEAALATERARAESAEREVADVRGRAESAEREVAEVRGRAESAEREVAEVRARADGAQPQAAAARAQAERLERDAAAARARAENAESELNGMRARADGAGREAAAARACAENITSELEGVRARAAGAEGELAAARGRVAELERAQATTAAAIDQAGAERAAREELEGHLAEARRRASDAEASRAAEQAEATRTRAELLARAEFAEAAIAEARATGERATAAAQRAEALAELARGRAEGLETALASARQVEAEGGTALERDRVEIARLRAALEHARAETEAAREAARHATERLDRQRRELELRSREAHIPTAAANYEPPRQASAPVRARTGPAWSHRAQRGLTASLAAATEWRSGLKDVLRVVGAQGGWDAAVAWCPDERAKALRCVAMWMLAPDQLGLFETATWQRRQSATASMAGRAARGDHATWLDDVRATEDPQLAAAAEVGMRGALLVPIRHEGETSGVLELLTREPGGSDPELAAAMEAVALQLAHFEHLLRRGAEPRWRMGRM